MAIPTYYAKDSQSPIIAHNSHAEIFISNSTNDVSLYKLQTTTDNHAMLLFASDISQGSVTSAALSQGYAPQPASGDTPNVILEDVLYISNSNYLKIKMKTGDPSAQTGQWWVQGIRKI